MIKKKDLKYVIFNYEIVGKLFSIFEKSDDVSLHLSLENLCRTIQRKKSYWIRENIDKIEYNGQIIKQIRDLYNKCLTRWSSNINEDIEKYLIKK